MRAESGNFSLKSGIGERAALEVRQVVAGNKWQPMCCARIERQ